MRYVAALYLKEGMVVAKTLYDKEHNILLAEGNILKNNYINRIRNLGYQGIYIKNDSSEDIIVKDVISEELRSKAIRAVEDVFVYTNLDNEYADFEIKQKINKITKIIQKIIDNLLDNEVLIVNLVDLKMFDDYTFYHSVNVTVLSLIIGIELRLTNDELFDLGLGAILHDIGKIFIDKDILNKKGKLDKKEVEKIREHPYSGSIYLKNIFKLKPCVCECALHHHERYDGKGYPSGIKGKDISLYGRIIAVCDVYDALISKRVYREAMLPSEAMEYIMANGGRHFDLDIVLIFVKKVAPYPIGTTVTLSNGLTGIVVKNYEECCMRPILKIIKDENKNLTKSYYLDLRDDLNFLNITIKESLKKVC